VLAQVKLAGFEERRVTDLSGGEQQRVALARALAPRPRLLMFDEPLGALDRSLRERLMDELRGILHATRVPAIYVTHDQEEAFTLADRLLLLHEGEIILAGTPADVWAEPESAWAARFLDVGNILEGVARGDGRIETSIGVFGVGCRHKHLAGEKVELLVRPYGAFSWVDGSRGHPAGDGDLHGLVVDVLSRQDRFKVVLESGLYFYLSEAPQVGEEIRLVIPASAIQCLS